MSIRVPACSEWCYNESLYTLNMFVCTRHWIKRFSFFESLSLFGLAFYTRRFIPPKMRKRNEIGMAAAAAPNLHNISTHTHKILSHYIHIYVRENFTFSPSVACLRVRARVCVCVFGYIVRWASLTLTYLPFNLSCDMCGVCCAPVKTTSTM